MQTAIATIDTNLPAEKPQNTRLKIGRKLRIAVDLMVFEGQDMATAATNAKTSTRAIRKAFEKAHVLTYIRKRKDVLRASISAKNIQRLGEIRDAANNMPAIHAIRQLENDSDDNAVRRVTSSSPGLIVQIINSAPAAAPPTITLTPNEEPERG